MELEFRRVGRDYDKFNNEAEIYFIHIIFLRGFINGHENNFNLNQKVNPGPLALKTSMETTAKSRFK